MGEYQFYFIQLLLSCAERNCIAHEFDFNFKNKKVGVKIREQRSKQLAEDYTDMVIDIMNIMENKVNEILTS